MSTNSDSSTIDLAQPLQLGVPSGDDPAATSCVLNAVLDTTDLSDVLRDIVKLYVDDAPTSAAHVLDLSGALARTVLDWISRWPS